MTGKWAFVDECKAKKYLLVATIVDPKEMPEIRKLLNGLRMKGQRRIHFATESDSRRKQILSALKGCKFNGIYELAPSQNEKLARQELWERLIPRLVVQGVSKLFIELDETNMSLGSKANLSLKRQCETSTVRRNPRIHFELLMQRTLLH